MSIVRRARSSGRRTILLVVLAALLVAPVAAPAAGGSPSALDCDASSGVVPFDDVNGNVHAPSIVCLAAWGVANGYHDGTYRPERAVSRAQLATFLHRLLEALDNTVPPGPSGFTDVAPGDTHAESIDALAAADIVRGQTSTTFGANAAVTRGQLASIISRTHEQVFGATLPHDSTVSFADIAGSVHETGIIRLASAEVVTGHTDGTFGPEQQVTRAQMAAFLGRYTALLVADGFAEAPEPDGLGAWETPTTSAWPLGAQRHFGVATWGNGWNAGEFEDVADVAGYRPTVVVHYLGFDHELSTRQLETVSAAGATTLVTWEPYDWDAGTVEQPRFQLRRIIDGEFDVYLRRTAEALKDFGGPVMLRFAHEMNGDWYPWSEQVNDNRPGEYVAAWRHVHDLFARAGVDNVSWVWSPNVEYAGSQPLAEVYPGGDYVDAVAVDGYNWGTAESWSTWQSPSEIFDPTFRAVRRLAPDKPLMIGETGSAEAGGDKALWISRLFTWLEANPDVRALVWFNLNKETDWRIESSRSAAEAFAEGLDAWSPAS